ncbi:MAG: hypothetical protein ABI927_02115 [Gaiellaceae bacterium]
MHGPPPKVRGGIVVRWAALVSGLALFAFGIVLLLESRLGLSPWDVLSQGIAKHSPLSFGNANIAAALVVLVVAWWLGARIGPGTVANAILIGVFLDLLLGLSSVKRLGHESLAIRSAELVGGIALIGAASALYIGAALGAGPRDSLMLVVSRRSGIRAGIVRTAIESVVTVAGFLLGGKVGIGTLAFAFGIGPAVEASFWLLARSPASVAATPSTIELA